MAASPPWKMMDKAGKYQGCVKDLGDAIWIVNQLWPGGCIRDGSTTGSVIHTDESWLDLDIKQARDKALEVSTERRHKAVQTLIDGGKHSREAIKAFVVREMTAGGHSDEKITEEIKKLGLIG